MKKKSGRLTGLIRRAIFALKDGTLFTTRQLLAFGFNRNALDKALARMHNKGELERVARGVYRKRIANQPAPTLFEIARMKAIAFGRSLYPHTTNLRDAADSATESIESSIHSVAKERGELMLGTDGPSSCFSTIVGLVRTKHLIPRKVKLEKKLNGSPVGFFIRTLWEQGRSNINWDDVRIALSFSNFGREDRKLIRQSGTWMPGWMAKVLANEYQSLLYMDDPDIYRPDQLRDMRQFRPFSPPASLAEFEMLRLTYEAML